MKRLYIILSAIMFLCASCVREEDGGKGEDARTIVFTLSNSTTPRSRATRAVDDLTENEAAINRVDIFFYDQDGTTCLFYPATNQLVLDEENGKVTVRVPESIYEGSLLGNTCKIYVLVNCYGDRSDLEGQTLAGLKDTVLENEGDRIFNGGAAPVDFFMESDELTATLTAEQGLNLGKITLKRAAAKVVVDVSSAKITGYTPQAVRVRLSNYLDKTKLGNANQYDDIVAGDLKTATKTLARQENNADNPFLMGEDDAFYTYANDWNADIDRETHVILEVDWLKAETGAQVQTYYYRIPFSYINAQGDAALHRNKTVRNYVYQFVVNVSQLGGLDPEDALTLTANFDVIDWNSSVIEVSILSFHYLLVYNRTVDVYNNPDHTWEYKSSGDIDWLITNVECTQYFSDGSSSLIQYVDGQPQYPTVTLSTANDKTYITIASAIPENYVPLKIVVKVFNAAQLFSDITLTIYPNKYVTSTPSTATGDYVAGAYNTRTGTEGNGDYGSNSPTGERPNNINFNFFRVSTPSLDVADVARGMSIGDPTENSYGTTIWDSSSAYYRTRTDEESNNIVSPDFIVASSRGITSRINWTLAQTRCARYREYPYPAGTWRMPTMAEMKIIANMQNDANSAIKDLFVTSGNGWWTAYQGNSINALIYTFENDPTGIYQPTTTFVRCVHDTWRD